MPPEDIRHLRVKLVKAAHGHEIFLEDIRVGLPRAGLQLGDVVARLVVAPYHRRPQVDDGIDHVLPEPLPEREFRDDPDELPVEPVAFVPPDQAFLDRHRPVRPAPRDRPDGVIPRRIDVPVVEHGIRGIPDVAEEVVPVAADRHDLVAPRDLHVVGELERGLGYHADAAVAAYRPVEDVAVRCRRRIDDAPVGEDHLDRLHRKDQGARVHVAAVAVHAEGPSDGEVGVRLHDAHRQVVGIDLLLDIPPGGACLDRDRLLLRVERHDLVEAPHVDVQASLGGDLAALAFAGAADRDGPARAFHGGAYLVDRRGRNDAADDDGVELRDIVDHLVRRQGERHAEQERERGGPAHVGHGKGGKPGIWRESEEDRRPSKGDNNCTERRPREPAACRSRELR